MDNEKTVRLRGGARKGAGRPSIGTVRVWAYVPGVVNTKMEKEAKRLKLTRSKLISQILTERYGST